MTVEPAAEPSVEYGHRALSDVLPSALHALGLAEQPNPLELAAAGSVVVLLVDGLGARLLAEHADAAPFLSGLSGRTLTAGFPTTTATSLTSLGLGCPPGVHGLVGYSSRLDNGTDGTDGIDEPMNWLRWQGTRSGRSLLDVLPPETVQPRPTMFELARAAGVAVSVVSAPAFEASGITRAALRGGRYRPAFTAADTAMLAGRAATARPSLVYCYASELDLIGHVYGCRSAAWRAQLSLIDHGARLLADGLPAATRLLITADHGMVDVPESAKIDYDASPDLADGVEMVAGESRVRYLYVQAGQQAAVRRRWQDRLGDRVTVLDRGEVIDRGWLGPQVSAVARERVGDLVVLARDDSAVVRRRAESRLAAMVGHHGALTEDELLVPLLTN